MNDDEERRLQIAAFRHRLIAEAIEADDEGVSAALKEVARGTHHNPDGEEESVGLSTLWRWLTLYRKGGLLALCPKPRKDKGALRAYPSSVLERAEKLRCERPKRATKTIIDILVRKKIVKPKTVARFTLDRHLNRRGLSRRMLGSLGRQTYRRIETSSPLELVVGDFHQGPYVRVGWDGAIRRAQYGGFIDHFSRYVPEGRYYLAEDFVAVRFGFRRLLVVTGKPEKLYLDRGPGYQATRFHAACELLGIKLVHSRAYRAEGRGVKERFNRTLKEQFESEVRAREEAPTIDELNAWFEAWLAELTARRALGDQRGSRRAFRPRRRLATSPAHGAGGRVPASARASYCP